LLALVKLQHRHDQITRIGDLPRFKQLGDYAQRGILIAMLGGIIVWVSFPV
jgi:hypothetical protein